MGSTLGKSTWLTWNINPETPMVFDIAAIQYIYGANYSYKTGDDVYTFNSLNPFFKTIWDAGGDDTIDITNFSTNCVIDLIPGNYSSIRFPKPADTGGQTATYDGTNNLGIAYNCYIENVKCGTGNDQIVGNDFANELDGGDGNDTLDGGDGIDTVILNGNYADYSKSLNSTTNLYTFIKNTGISTTDYISNIEIFKFTNRTLKAANLFDLPKVKWTPLSRQIMS